MYLSNRRTMETKPERAVEVPSPKQPFAKEPKINKSEKPVVLQVVIPFFGLPTDKRIAKYESMISGIVDPLLKVAPEQVCDFDDTQLKKKRFWFHFTYTVYRRFKPVDIIKDGETTTIQGTLFLELRRKRHLSVTYRRSGVFVLTKKSS